MLLPILLLAFAMPARAAPTFEARIAAAESAIGGRGGFGSTTPLFPGSLGAVRPGVPPGLGPAGGGAFVRGAEVDAQGRVHAADVRPASPIARCFAERLSRMQLRPPPAASRGWPIVVRMQTRR